MNMMFYQSPEQIMADRAEYARTGIARGRAAVASCCREGICLVAENPSNMLHKISEVYDRLAFAAAGRYNEFEALRIAGIRQADLRGFTYSRADVTGRSLANAYSQQLGQIFAATNEKPFAVDLIVAELGSAPAHDRLFRISFDGSVEDAADMAVVGGAASQVAERVMAGYNAEHDFKAAIKNAVTALADGRDWGQTAWEVAVLDRGLNGTTGMANRTFRRIELAGLMGEE